MADWNDDQVRYFVALVQQFPALWDPSRRDFSDNIKKRTLWDKIVDEMSLRYPENGPYTAGKFFLRQSNLCLFSCSSFFTCAYPFPA